MLFLLNLSIIKKKRWEKCLCGPSELFAIEGFISVLNCLYLSSWKQFQKNVWMPLFSTSASCWLGQCWFIWSLRLLFVKQCFSKEVWTQWNEWFDYLHHLLFYFLSSSFLTGCFIVGKWRCPWSLNYSLSRLEVGANWFFVSVVLCFLRKLLKTVGYCSCIALNALSKHICVLATALVIPVPRTFLLLPSNTAAVVLDLLTNSSLLPSTVFVNGSKSSSVS